ncbi:hypothetical protein BC833DRAFT_596894 [Globomyces pollinis-pini]|nr:hypothetical protein BC833DRAFT_596894 [Globomyces pollinis-pini]
MPIQDLPHEILSLIFSYLDPKSVVKFKLLSNSLQSITKDPFAQTQLLCNHYGKGQVLYAVYANHRKLLTEKFGTILLHKKDVAIPRFVAQLMVRDYHTKAPNPPPLTFYVAIINATFAKYEDLSLFKESDHRKFETLVRSTPTDPTIIPKLRDLIINYKFFPTRAESHKLVCESIYLLGRLDLTLITDLQRYTGFQLEHINNAVLENVFENTISISLLKSFLKVGFQLTDLSVKRAIATARPIVLDILIEMIDPTRLKLLVHQTIHELFGPYLDKDLSLNVPWDSKSVQRIIRKFGISDDVIAEALLSDKSSVCTMDQMFPNFPVTRVYLKTRPYEIWQYVIDNYGPEHPFSIACFDDALSRAVADDYLHELIHYYLDQGIVLRPRHIKILACRVLHRNMTSSALDVLIHLKSQVLERHRISFGPFQNDKDHTTQIQADELTAFHLALHKDFLNNADWKQRSSTMQIQGGLMVGAFRIDRTPRDVTEFIRIGRELSSSIEKWGCASDEVLVRDRQPQSMPETFKLRSWCKVQIQKLCMTSCRD